MTAPHRNARIAAGQSTTEAKKAFGLSVRTGRKWLAGFRKDGHAALRHRRGRAHACRCAPGMNERKPPGLLIWMLRQPCAWQAPDGAVVVAGDPVTGEAHRRTKERA
ncbi:helix-turn-helix domain-containing protein [Rhodovulum sulfidophilum]|uniref:helix-turn-helix domain-containing protein n=1 Tax=Rhodovulum sulfidophilum TaxID=35806 RepID=UPI00192180E5|nr:helix-turn-helix domain-containing protein [Rhodovulum sulfidophilum]